MLPEAEHRLQQGSRNAIRHKDGLNRYSEIAEDNQGKDHYLRPDDGKLDILRVQQTPDNHRQTDIPTTWEPPPALGRVKALSRAYLNTARAIMTWTFNDYVKAKFKRDNGRM
jgi:hypothetical protein